MIRWGRVMVAAIAGVWLHALGAALAFRVDEGELGAFAVVGAIVCIFSCAMAGDGMSKERRDEAARLRRLENELEAKSWALSDMRKACETSEREVKRLEAEIRAHGLVRVPGAQQPEGE